MSDAPATNDGEDLSLTIPEDRAGLRLDHVLAELLPERSRAFLRKLFDRGLVALDGSAAKPAQKVKAGQSVRLRIPPAQALEAGPEDIPLDILYEDGDIIVLNKQAGVVVHPSQGYEDGTLVNALLHHSGDSLSAIGGVLRPGIVHRLDRDTTGCLVAAKNDAAHAGLMRQFMARDVTKIYLALTEGAPKPAAGRVEGNMGRSTRDRKKHALLNTGGRPSCTLYKTVENYGALALVECQLLTGRTHQARVHLASRGAPVLCDRDYGRRERFTDMDSKAALAWMLRGEKPPAVAGQGRVILGRQGLHAWQLGFMHPRSGEALHFTAELPADMLAVLAPFRAERGEG